MFEFHTDLGLGPISREAELIPRAPLEPLVGISLHLLFSFKDKAVPDLVPRSPRSASTLPSVFLRRSQVVGWRAPSCHSELSSNAPR